MMHCTVALNPTLASLDAWASLLILAGLVLLGWVIFAFNRLVRDRNLLREAWSGIDVQLTRRSNLIPNLVEVVKGYSAHEKSVLEEVTRLRTGGEQTGDLKSKQTSENALTDQLKRLLALAESYPDLKADKSFLTLQEQLSEIEDQLQMARRYYNGAVRNFNIRTEAFPSNIVARCFTFKRAEFFEIETATHRQVPKVEME